MSFTPRGSHMFKGVVSYEESVQGTYVKKWYMVKVTPEQISRERTELKDVKYRHFDS